MPSQLTPKQAEKLMSAIEASFEREVAKEKDRYLAAVIRSFELTGLINPLAFNEHKRMMIVIETKYTRLTIHAFGLRTRSSLKTTLNQAKQFEFDSIVESEDFFDKMARTWMVTEGAQQAALASETTREDIRRVLISAQEGELKPVSEIIKDLKAITVINTSRAKVIARTETHNSALFASEETAKAISLDQDRPMLKDWIPAEDERTRVSHAAMASKKPIPLDVDFTVGGVKMSRPGDPKGGAANVINCRCVLVYEFAKE